jgi:hypothetical protein
MLVFNLDDSQIPVKDRSKLPKVQQKLLEELAMNAKSTHFGSARLESIQMAYNIQIQKTGEKDKFNADTPSRF